VRTGDQAAAAQVYNNLGMVCADMREHSQAVLYFDRGIEIADRLGVDVLLAKLRANLAEPLIGMNRFDAAERTLDEAEAVARRVYDHMILASIRRFRAAIARLQDDLDLACEHLDDALEIAEAHDLELEHAEALGAYARVHRARGDREQALSTLEEALRAFRKLGAARETRRLEEVRVEWTGSAAGDLE